MVWPCRGVHPPNQHVSGPRAAAISSITLSAPAKTAVAIAMMSGTRPGSNGLNSSSNAPIVSGITTGSATRSGFIAASD